MPATSPVDKLREIADHAGLQRIHMLAWRDLDDVEAGGSELHASTVARLWAEAGIEVTMRTSFAAGHPPEASRDGYRVVRRAGRYAVFPRAAAGEILGHHGQRDALVEIWNGMPFFSPVWARGPKVVWLHHVHAEMWKMALPEPWATLGGFVERRIAPPFYRRTPVVTLSESSRDEIVGDLGFDPESVSVVPPGIDPRFEPGPDRSPAPLVVAVGRLVPVKRFDLLIDALVAAKETHPALEAVIVGEGYERAALEARVAAAGAQDWLRLPGRVDDAGLVDLYQRAWLVAASSLREGWGMTLTEAAACGTPAVATRIGGHADAIVDGETGLLVSPEELGGAIGKVLGDTSLRDRLSANARARAEVLTWERTAEGTLQVLADAACRKR